MLPELLKNHLSAVNISLDTLDPVLYKNITGVDALTKVFQSIQACVAAGLKTKVNAVLSESLFEEKNVIIGKQLGKFQQKSRQRTFAQQLS